MLQPRVKTTTLRDVLVAKLGNPDRRRLHRLASAVQKRLGPMSRADSYAVLADEQGIKLNKYLVEPDLGRVRGIIANGAARAAAAPAGNGGRPRATTRTVLKAIVIDGESLVMDDPILPAQVAADAKRMAGIYPLTYVFENSVRELVVRVMQKKYGTGWWTAPAVPGPVLRNVEKNKKREGKIPWHGARGAHEIHYTTIDDLLSIITTNANWALFEPILGEQNGVSYLIQVIEQSRHTIAHHNPLSTDDITGLKVNIRRWQKILKARHDLI